MALIVLAFTFGTFVAMGLPIVSLDKRLPQVSVEGHGYFAERDGAAAAPAGPVAGAPDRHGPAA